MAQSVVNYGLPALAGHTVSSADPKNLERVLRQSILQFEPRLLPNSLKVRAIVAEEMSHSALSFDIEGQLWAQPAPLRLLLKTDVDLETGNVVVTDRGSG